MRYVVHYSRAAGKMAAIAAKGHHAYGREEALLDAFLAHGGRLDSGVDAGIGVNEMNLLARMSRRKQPWVVGVFRDGRHGFEMTAAGVAEVIRQQRVLAGPINV